MSRLILVRHGQARAFSRKPDRLSPTGWRQARALGQYWVENGVRFDAAYHGTLLRQKDSYQAVRARYEEAGKRFPDASVLEDLNEYAAQDLVSSIAPSLAGSDPAFSVLWQTFREARGRSDHNRHFQRMFEALVARWVTGALRAPGLEPWGQFHARVKAVLHQIRGEQGGGKRVVAFTSGGPIGVAVQVCLRAPEASALEVNWRVRNTSVTSFLFSGGRFSLDGFNELPHLSQRPDLVTFR